MKEYQRLTEIKEGLRSGSLSCVNLVNHYLEQIELQKHLNAFIEVYAQEALVRAEGIDQKIREGKAGKLAGMVIGIKDVLCYAGHGVQASSKILDGYKSPYTATAVQRLLDEDVIIIGRQNCDEFAMGSSNESSWLGPVLNATDNERVPGGSSGGSAVAVQAGLCHASIGSDTGGSVRQPSAFCGTVGLKPSYGRISRWGLLAYASSFDCIGPITKSVEDAALLLEVMAGADEYDSTVSVKPVPEYSKLKNPGSPLRIGYLREGVESEAVSAETRNNTERLLKDLEESGHTVQAIDLPYTPYLLPAYYILTTAEASSNLSRYDGIRYGYRHSGTGDLEQLYKKSRTEGFGYEVRKRILLGTFVLSADYYDAYYTKAQRIRRWVYDETVKLFDSFDFIISPVAPTTAFRLNENQDDPLQMYLADIFTVQANVTGMPCIAIPNGADKNGLHVGIQVMGNSFEEDKLLSFAQYLEARTVHIHNTHSEAL